MKEAREIGMLSINRLRQFWEFHILENAVQVAQNCCQSPEDTECNYGNAQTQKYTDHVLNLILATR